MAQEDVEATIKKAVADDTFRRALGKDLERTLESHQIELSSEELEALKQVDWSRPLPSSIDMVAGTWVHIYKSSMV